MGFRKILLVVGSALLFSGATSFAASDSYRLSIQLSLEGHVFAWPILVVNPGIPAAVEVSGSDGHRFEVTMDSTGQGIVKVATHLTTDHGSVSPTLLVRFGRSASVRVGEIGILLTAAPFSG